VSTALTSFLRGGVAATAHNTTSTPPPPVAKTLEKHSLISLRLDHIGASKQDWPGKRGEYRGKWGRRKNEKEERKMNVRRKDRAREKVREITKIKTKNQHTQVHWSKVATTSKESKGGSCGRALTPSPPPKPTTAVRMAIPLDADVFRLGLERYLLYNALAIQYSDAPNCQ
jgi:hypothetical protein